MPAIRVKRKVDSSPKANSPTLIVGGEELLSPEGGDYMQNSTVSLTVIWKLVISSLISVILIVCS